MKMNLYRIIVQMKKSVQNFKALNTFNLMTKGDLINKTFCVEECNI